MRISLTAYPNSGIEEALFTIQGEEGPPFQAGISSVQQPAEFLEIPTTFDFRGEELSLTVQSQGRSAAVLARRIPTDADVHLIGVNKDLFFGMFVHSHDPTRKIGPRCELRCSRNEQAVTGPGCISCQKGKLIFKVCC
jgi:hypothetical protein